jgi:hypothetical protein
MNSKSLKSNYKLIPRLLSILISFCFFLLFLRSFKCFLSSMSIALEFDLIMYSSYFPATFIYFLNYFFFAYNIVFRSVYPKRLIALLVPKLDLILHASLVTPENFKLPLSLSNARAAKRWLVLKSIWASCSFATTFKNSQKLRALTRSLWVQCVSWLLLPVLIVIKYKDIY